MAVIASAGLSSAIAQIEKQGYTIIEDVFDNLEIRQIQDIIDSLDTSGETYRKSAGLFAIRQFLKEAPAALPLLQNQKLTPLIQELFGEGYFIVKSIYFDKPGESNWFVATHQDLTISVDKKLDVDGYGLWTVKQQQFAVQPPLSILENIFTVRIHLDDTDINNGALKVAPGSHSKGVYRPEAVNLGCTEVICDVPKGGIMIMKPLLMHSSARSASNNRRRVIHIEFSNMELAEGLGWAEKMQF